MVSFAEYKANPTIKNRNALVEANLGLARFAAAAIAKKTPVDYEDLEQVAMLGLIVAVERFNPGFNVKFSRFALPIINGRILNFVRDKAHLIKIPRDYFVLLQKSKKIIKDFVKQHGKQPTHAEVAEILGISVNTYKIIANSYLNCRYVGELKTEPAQLNDVVEVGCEIPEAIDLVLRICDCDASYEQLVVKFYFAERIKIPQIAKILETRAKDVRETIREFLLSI